MRRFVILWAAATGVLLAMMIGPEVLAHVTHNSDLTLATPSSDSLWARLIKVGGGGCIVSFSIVTLLRLAR